MKILFGTILLFCTGIIKAQSFVSIESENDYTLSIEMEATDIDAPNNCFLGYNYDVRVNYNVSLTGPGVPNNVWLQGILRCGSQTHYFNLPGSGGSGEVESNNLVWRWNNDCRSATVESLNCTDYSVFVVAPGISIQEFSMPWVATLPVELSFFRPQLSEGGKVLLEWETASETNNDYFTIQRSKDGLEWEDIQEVQGAGNSTSYKEYNTYDNNPWNGVSYYRLKQTDFDGSFSYSDIEAIESELPREIIVYPNPAREKVTVQGLGSISCRVQIIDLQGRVLFSQSAFGNNESISVSSLSPGIYRLLLVNGHSNEILKSFNIYKEG